MPMPDRIPIADQGSEHLTELGRHAGGLYLYLALVSHAYPEDKNDASDASPGFWIATLHTFDEDGTHLRSEVRPVPGDDDGGYGRAQSVLASMLDELTDREEGDIEIRPFSVVNNGFRVGLVVGSEYDYADLVPEGIRFSEPWDGWFST